MSEAKLRKKLGIGPRENRMTVGVAATSYGRLDAGVIGMATALIKMPLRQIERAAGLGFDKADAVRAIQEGFEQNRHITDSEDFSIAVSAYIGQTDHYHLAKAQGADGLWLKLYVKNGKSLARMTMAVESDGIRQLMDETQHQKLEDSSLMVLVLPSQPKDEEFGGGTADVQNGVITFNGKTVTISASAPPAGPNRVM